MPSSEIYKLTETGRKIAKSTSPSNRDDILDHLYTHKRATLDELSAICGVNRFNMKVTLRGKKYKTLVVEDGAGGFR